MGARTSFLFSSLFIVHSWEAKVDHHTSLDPCYCTFCLSNIVQKGGARVREKDIARLVSFLSFSLSLPLFLYACVEKSWFVQNLTENI